MPLRQVRAGLIYRKSALRQPGYYSQIPFGPVRIMDYSEECRAVARECEQLARDISTRPEFRQKFLVLAARWRELAEKFDKLERPTLH